MQITRKESLNPGKASFVFLTLFVSLFFCSCIFADCDTRPITQKEKAYYDSVLGTFKKAIPPGPEGWDSGYADENEEIEEVGVGIEKSPFIVGYSISWNDTQRIEAGQAAVEAELERQQENPDDASIEAAVERLKKLMPHDVSVIIRLEANRFSKEFYDPVKSEPAMVGALVYRTDGQDDPNKGWYEGTTYVFLGKGWKYSDAETPIVQTEPIKGTPYTQVQTIIVEVQADQARARSILERIDWDALKSLIKT